MTDAGRQTLIIQVALWALLALVVAYAVDTTLQLNNVLKSAQELHELLESSQQQTQEMLRINASLQKSFDDLHDAFKQVSAMGSSGSK